SHQCSKISDHHTIQKPLNHILSHRRRTAGQHSQPPHRSAFHFLGHGRRFHFLERKIRKEIGRAPCHARTSQRVGDTVFIWQFAIITFVITEHHVHDETGEKDNHSRNQNGKPQG